MVVPLKAARFCQKVGGGTTLCCRLQPEHDDIVVGRPAWWLTAALVTCWRAWLDCPDALMTWRGRPWRLRRSKCRAVCRRRLCGHLCTRAVGVEISPHWCRCAFAASDVGHAADAAAGRVILPRKSRHEARLQMVMG